MKPRRLYLDTSVIGGYFDVEFSIATRRLWTLAQAGEYRFFTSQITERELRQAPELVRQLFSATFQELLPISPEAEVLALAYLEREVVSAKYKDDALHVAIATVEGISPVVSWNFKHLVNLRREEGFNAVNLLNGYPQLRIVNPKELDI